MVASRFLAVSASPVRVFNLDAAERMRRFALKAKLEPVEDVPAAGPLIVANRAFAWDPAWLAHVRDTPGLAVTWGGQPALVHLPDAADAPALIAAMKEAGPLPPIAGLSERRVEEGTTLYNQELRKRENAYLLPLRPETARAVEKASYDGAYKGVTDLLTLYLWRRPAFHLTRWAALAGLSPNAVTIAGILLCILATYLFAAGWYWAGLAAGLGFMVLDTVDGKLARCTGTSSDWGNILDHGVDLVHPPFWYWAWGYGLVFYGRPLAGPQLGLILAVIVGFYVVQRLIEGVFIQRFKGLHIHVWERIDSRFRLITARRNPNMVILFASLLVGRPDWGLIAVAWWTVLSCLFHLVRLFQAMARAARGQEIRSWLA